MRGPGREPHRRRGEAVGHAQLVPSGVNALDPTATTPGCGGVGVEQCPGSDQPAKFARSLSSRVLVVGDVVVFRPSSSTRCRSTMSVQSSIAGAGRVDTCHRVGEQLDELAVRAPAARTAP